MNTERVAEVADAILADPASYNQDFFFEKLGLGTASCGSTQCICGRAIVQFHSNGVNIERDWLTKPEDRSYEGIWELGQELLELNSAQANRLFTEVPTEWFEDNCLEDWNEDDYNNIYTGFRSDEVMAWPYEFAKRYYLAESGQERAQVAYDRIHHFIKTDGAE